VTINHDKQQVYRCLFSQTCRYTPRIMRASWNVSVETSYIGEIDGITFVSTIRLMVTSSSGIYFVFLVQGKITDK